MSWSTGGSGTKAGLIKRIEEYVSAPGASTEEFNEAKPIILSRLAALNETKKWNLEANGSSYDGGFSLTVRITELPFYE